MSAEAAGGEPDPLIGEVLASRYRIEQRLGEGAMGAVYRARHVKVGRPFAVKVLHPRLLDEPKLAQRFAREAELAGRLRHPNVIGVVDVGETAAGLHYMVMDFAEGRDLAALLEEAPMPAPRIIHLTRQLLEGLYHAHEQGLIHRDFKPENVIVERDAHGQEVPRIVDFGIAILRDGGDASSGHGRLTTNGLVLGTPHYMAPEQAVADALDHRVDLFALGIVVYELLCGQLPFDGTGVEVARANLLMDPPRIAQRVPGLEVDPLLEAFARRLMEKSRDARPPTAKAARELLDLIERDRTAAAAALGVSLTASGRSLAVTTASRPQPRIDPRSASDTFPPSTSASLEPTAPGHAADARTPGASATADERDVTTEQTSSEERPSPRGRTWLLGGLALTAAGGMIALALSTRGTPATPSPAAPPTPPAAPASPTAAAAVSPGTATPPPAVEPAATAPIAGATATAAPAAAEPGSRAPTAATSSIAAHDAHATAPSPSPSAQPPRRAPATATPAPPARGGTRVATTRPPARADAASTMPRAPTATASPGSAAEPSPATRTGDAAERAALTALYQRVGRDLAALGSDAGELWMRYRNVQYQAALLDAAKRTAAIATLERLARDVAAAKQR